MNQLFDRAFYRETIGKPGVGEGKVIRQRRETGEYAHVKVMVQPLKRGQGVVFSWSEGQGIAERFIHAVTQGIEDVMNSGVLAGLPVADVHVSVEDGSYHDIDSTANSFIEATAIAVREALQLGQPFILEALVSITVSVPEKLFPIVMSGLNRHRGKIHNHNISADVASPSVSASVPASHIRDLIAELLEMTSGRASISTLIEGFEPRIEPPDTSEAWVLRS